MDWNAIKTEYITDPSSSYRKLAEKHKVSIGTLQKRAKKEKWVEQRRQSGDRRVAKTVAAYESKQAKKISRIQDITDKLLDKIEQAVDELDIQLTKDVVKTKTIEYKNEQRPDKPTKETVHEKEKVIEVKSIVDRTGLNAIASALRSIKEVQMLKTELDEREQEARIAKLQREVEADSDTSSEIEVVFEVAGVNGEWAE